MQPGFRESDWKIFRELRALALERFCQRVLDHVGQLAADTEKGSHERYLAVYGLVQERDQCLADMFNNPRRSTALVQLARIGSEGLLTDAEIARFSDETRASVEVFLDLWRTEPAASAEAAARHGK
jgi:hypothetical protein